VSLWHLGEEEEHAERVVQIAESVNKCGVPLLNNVVERGLGLGFEKPLLFRFIFLCHGSLQLTWNASGTPFCQDDRKQL
jgi:hypothetical protein